MSAKKTVKKSARSHSFVPFQIRELREKQPFTDADVAQQEETLLKTYSNPNARPMAVLFRFYRGHYHHLLLSALFFLIKTSPAWLLPVVTERVIDAITAGGPTAWQQILFWLALELVLVLINIPTHCLHVHFLSLSTRSIEAGLRGAMVRKLQQLSIGFHKEMESGRIQSKVMRDVEAIEGLSSSLFSSILNIIVNITVALIAVLSTNVTVFFFFLAAAPLGAVLMFLFRKDMGARNHEFRAEVERTSATVVEMEELVPVARAHALEQKEVRRMTRQLKLVAEKGYRLDVLQQLFVSANYVVFQGFQILCLAFTAFLAIKGMLTVGYVVMYQSYFATLIAQISALLSLLPIFTKGSESVRSVGEILASPDVEDNRGKKRVKDVQGAFEFKNVFFEYDAKTRVLNGLDLSVKAGETIALVGPSGSGKTTVLNLLIGFNRPTAGQVLLDGQDLTAIDLRSYRRHLAVVPQNSILFSGTIKDNITYGMPGVTKAQLWEAIEAANLGDLIRSLPNGVNTVVGEHGSKLSGGQRQRIAIARAIIRNPRIILFDEATSALDTVSEKEIQHAITALSKDRTTFIVAHRLSTIMDADKIAVVKDGRLAEFGTYDELMAKQGEFYHMKELQG